MRKRTRRLIAQIILVTLLLSIDSTIKTIIAVPLIELLLIDWDSWNYKREAQNGVEN